MTLACAKIQENAAFCESQNHLVAVAWLPTLAASIPVHVILGEKLDIVYVQNMHAVGWTHAYLCRTAPT